MSACPCGAVAVAALVLAGCYEAPCYVAPNRAHHDLTSYPEGAASYVARAGFELEDGRGEVDRERLERLSAAVEACVQRAAASGGWTCRQGYYAGAAELEVRPCMRVQVAPDWYSDSCGNAQKFPCRAPAASCQAKGLEPTAACQCSCRHSIQRNTTLVVTPDLALYPAALTQLLSGCDFPWEGPLFECATITVDKGA